MMCIILLTQQNAYAYKYGLGSCLDQRFDQTIWSSIKKENIDGFIFLGDNVYGDRPNGSLEKMQAAYKTQKNRLPQWLMKEKEILAIWDDHDFGLNDGGKDYSLKREAELMFLNFWNIPESDVRRKREGIYFKETKNIDGANVEIIGLDTRYFRSKLMGNKKEYLPNINPNASILGKNQWQWFKSQMTNSNADIIIILSSIQVLATEHPYEKWSNFPLERNKLLELISDTKKNKTIIVVSGDRHRAGLYKSKDFIEITASSLNRPGSSFEETDRYLINQTFPEINYGILEIKPRQNKITVSIHGDKGVLLNSQIITLNK
tara:strand:+ start:321 stop:1277 length:957 start_codon:yes stop_codon:yes gene_type:complete